MRRLLLGLCVGIALSAPSAWPFRTGKPPTLTEMTPGQLAELNAFLERLWQLANGRYSHDLVTTNPNGVTRGDPGDTVLYNNGGSYKECHNVSSSAGGTTWRCDASALTAP